MVGHKMVLVMVELTVPTVMEGIRHIKEIALLSARKKISFETNTQTTSLFPKQEGLLKYLCRVHPISVVQRLEETTKQMATVQKSSGNDQTPIAIHNKLILYIGQKLNGKEEFQQLKGLFRTNPLAEDEFSNIRCVSDLFEKLEKHETIQVGDYDKLVEKLEIVHPELASHVKTEQNRIVEITKKDDMSAATASTVSASPTIEIHADLIPLIDQTVNRIETETNEKRFIETEAFRDAQKKLGKNRVIMIKGNTGDGKTSTAIQLMDWLIKEQPCRQPLQLHDINTLDKLSPDSSLVTFIDDIFGERNVRNTDVAEWNKRIINVKTLFVDQQMKANFLLVTIRNEVYNVLKKRSSKPVFTKDNTIDLSSETFSIAKERRLFLKEYTPKGYKWEEEEIESIVKSASRIGFPQCCCLFYNSVQLQAKRGKFFEKPFEFLKEALLRLPECCAILFLFLNGGEIKVTDLDPNSDQINQTLLEESFNINLIDGEEDRSSLKYERKVGFVKESLDRLLGFLVVKGIHWSGDEVYRFNHDSVHVTVAPLYWNKTPVGYIQNCRVEFLGCLTTSKTSSDMIVISSCHYNCLYERLLREFECKENVYHRMINSLDVWKDPVFVERFVGYWLNEREGDKRAVLNKACKYGVKECGLYLLSEGVKPDKDTDLWSLITGGDVFNLYRVKGDVDVLKKVVKYLNDEIKHDLLNKACDSCSKECGLYLLSEGVKPDKDTNLWSLITGGYDMFDKGNVDELKEVFKYLNDERKHDLLNDACRSGSTECGLYLLSKGAIPKDATLLYVARGGSVELLRKLLEYKVTITVRSKKNNNVLHLSCWREREEMVTELCEKYPDLVRDTTNDGCFPLHTATGNLSLFQTVERTTLQTLYKQCGKDGHVVHKDCVWGQSMSNLVDHNGWTVLHWSCKRGNKKICDYLCEKFPSLLTILDKEGRTVLHVSCWWGNMETGIYLCEKSPSLVTSVDNDGRTVLHVSCERGNKEICVYLCEKFPSLLRAVDKEGWTVLHVSCWWGNKEICIYLCEKCPSLLTSVDNKGRTVLHVSCERGNKEIYDYLRERCPSQ
ncbi:uncharacterized protein LOC132562360 [Ylistrum balloti]|uniref:uncharacterized protein LOC132562360 n=1 Tax=Ylistrum balloti TaxID=509963 RepID=UPI002905EC82|nr:uncharacterized protein LOC132562360 [Ylistrum balloti]